jgi:hypothetical protein
VPIEYGSFKQAQHLSECVCPEPIEALVSSDVLWGDGQEGIKCFGQDGWNLIRQQIALITDTSLGLVGLLAPPPSVEDIANAKTSISPSTSKKLQRKSGPPPEVVLGRAFLETQSTQTIEALQEYKNYVKFLDNQASFGKKLWEVLISKNKEVSDKISSLVAAYHQLESLSDKNFEAYYTNLSASMPIQARRDATQEEFDSRYALSFRKYSTSIIYAPAFPTEEPDAIGFQLDGQATGTMFSVLDPEVVGYTLIVQPSRSDASLELSIKALGPRRPETTGSEPVSAFLDACHQAQDDHEQNHQIWL